MNSASARLSADELSHLLSAIAAATTDAERSLLEEQVVASFLPLAAQLAGSYRNRGADQDDLEAVANLALLKAVRGFHADRGDFAPYASATIRGEIKKYFRDYCWTIRPSRSIQELQLAIARSTDERSQDRRPVTARAIADELGVDSSRVSEAMSASSYFTPRSLDEPSPGGRMLAEVLPDEDEQLSLVDDVLTLACGCEALTDAEREMLRMRFYQDRTQQEIADVLGISQMQVSRRLKSIFDTIRNHPRLQDIA